MNRSDRCCCFGAACPVINCGELGKLLENGNSISDSADGGLVSYDEALKAITADAISGKNVRPDWGLLIGASGILLDGVSADDIAGDKYSRFRSFLFDAGYVPITCKVARYPLDHLLYVRSGLLSNPSFAGVSGAKVVSMKSLGKLGRFGNQLWQYLFVRMYGLRNGLTVKVPVWEGEDFFGFLDARPSNNDKLETMVFFGPDDDDLELWEIDDVPYDVDFKGFFQNVPPQWRVHRELIRKLYTLKPEWSGAIEQLRSVLKRDGRALVTIHVRRGDYRTYSDKNPLFRLAPTDWYRALLDKMWPGLSRPLLHVSTDEPDVIKPEFRSYDQLDATFFSRDFGIPDHVRDFLLLQEAECLVACNSSFSTMAAVVGRPGQKCYLVDFRTKGFTPYDPWMESSFCARFIGDTRTLSFEGYGLRGGRKRSLLLRSMRAADLELQDELRRLRDRVRYLEGGGGQSVNRYAYRVWRAVRCR